MPRKPKRQRDPARSHGRCLAVASPPRLLTHVRRAVSGCGWESAKLSPAVLRGLMDRFAMTPLRGAAYHAHNQPGEQANDLPMVQRRLRGSSVWGSWRAVIEESIRDLEGMPCPRCGRGVTRHSMLGADLNVYPPGFSIWPHMDAEIPGGGHMAVLILLQAATAGGLFGVAGKKGELGVAWREAGTGPGTVARRRRDMLPVPLLEAGDVCILDSIEYIHEVTKVRGSVARVSIGMDLRCPSINPAHSAHSS